MESRSIAEPMAVVWTSAGTEAPPDLLGALSRGGLKVRHASGAYTALAELCAASALRSADDGKPPIPLALVLVNPDELDGPGLLCDAVTKYARQARCWMYTRGAQRLRAISPEDIAGWVTAVPGGSAGGIHGIERGGGESDNGPHRPLVTITRGDSDVVQGRPAVRSGPALRLVDEGAGREGGGPEEQAGVPGASGSEAEPQPRQVVTPEELQMLLEDDDQQD